jgi:hypothetical protein
MRATSNSTRNGIKSRPRLIAKGESSMNSSRIMILTASLIFLILLGGCTTPCPQIPREALVDLPVIKLPTEPPLNTRKLLDAKTGKPAGLLFPGDDAFKEAAYKVDLREAAELGAANTRAANKIFAIMRTQTKHWWQFWK